MYGLDYRRVGLELGLESERKQTDRSFGFFTDETGPAHGRNYKRNHGTKDHVGTTFLRYETKNLVFLRTTVFEPSRPLAILLVEIT
jgi:hypothetical protein